MNSVYLRASSLTTIMSCNAHHCRQLNPRYREILQISCSLRRRNSKIDTKSLSDQNIEMVIDVQEMANRASTSLRKFFWSSEAKFQRFVFSGRETIRDLRTLVMIDSERRVIISCRRSSLQFVANFVLWSCVVIFAARFLGKLVSGFQSGLRFGQEFLVRRDRSLAGRQVVVGRGFREREGKQKNKKGIGVSVNPLSPVRGSMPRVAQVASQKRGSTEGKKLPTWWPVLLPSPVLMMNRHESQREADRLIRAIMDNRMSGKDISEDDINQLRQICRTSGARVSIDTSNVRDSIYRASVDFVLNTCCSSLSHSTPIQINGEDVHQFVAGFADNIGVDPNRAARIVSAAVAARTRSRFLQAWALEMQGKRSEALTELSKICLIHDIFPPEESSPEMEMVAQGLKKHLRLEQRELLLNLLGEACGVENRTSVIEALGLKRSSSDISLARDVHSF